jgi:hypothetical protein
MGTRSPALKLEGWEFGVEEHLLNSMRILNL